MMSQWSSGESFWATLRAEFMAYRKTDWKILSEAVHYLYYEDADDSGDVLASLTSALDTLSNWSEIRNPRGDVTG